MPRAIKRHSHLTRNDFDIAALGYPTRRMRKHLDKCNHCRSWLRHLNNIDPDPEPKPMIRSPAAQRRAAYRDNDYVEREDEHELHRRRLLSGAEWKRLQSLATPALIGVLVWMLVMGLTRAEPRNREIWLFVTFVACMGAIMMVLMVAIERIELRHVERLLE